MQENWSFDHTFGTFPNLANGYGVPLSECFPTTSYQQTNFRYPSCIQPFNGDSTPNMTQGSGLCHSYTCALTGYDSGMMNGFIKAQTTNKWSNFSVSYVDGAVLPDYWDWASYYALDANFFSSVMSYSYPNHLEYVSPPGLEQACPLIKKCSPQFNLTAPTIVDLLNSAGITWAYYQQDWNDANQCQPAPIPAPNNWTGSGLNYWNVLPDWPRLQTSSTTCHLIKNGADLNRDLGRGDLPQVTWITPSLNDSDHAGCSAVESGGICGRPSSPFPSGQVYTANIVDKIERNQTLWGSTAIFLAWDDWGGYLDNRVPTQVDYLGYGIRVPLIVISPWVKPGVFYGPSDREQDFSALLTTIEQNWNLPCMTATRDCSVGSLLYMFDFQQNPLSPLLLPTNVLASYPLSSCSLCNYGPNAAPYTANQGLVLPQAPMNPVPTDSQGDPYD